MGEKVARLSSGHGRVQVVYYCPACGVEVVAYAWSMAGSGKRCPSCGVVAYLERDQAVLAKPKPFRCQHLIQRKKRRFVAHVGETVDFLEWAQCALKEGHDGEHEYD